MARLTTRLARIERRLAAAAADCPACKGRAGLRFLLPNEEPTTAPPCPRCGRSTEPTTFRIVPVPSPAPTPKTVS
ncbi:MAG: hypothetical protein ACK4WH_02625 [Phycisphaerales bacterium]